MRIAVIGSGYVGLVTGVVLAELGNDVIGVDSDPEKLDKLRRGLSPIYEPGVEERLRAGLREGFLRFTGSIAEATRESEIVFIAVGTPAACDGSPDLSTIRAAAAEIGANIEAHKVIVNKSTVPVGSGELVETIIREAGADRALFDVVSNPEFLREGSAVQDTLCPDRIVIGAKRPEAADPLIELYRPLNRPIIVTDLESAELIKYASNAFLATKISFVNAISRLCEVTGANIDDVARGMGADARIGGQFLGAGLGWGGSCFPKDVLGLVTTAERCCYDFKLLKAVWDINEEQTLHFLRRVSERLGGFAGRRISLLGLSFKPNTDDIREAKSLVLIRAILEGEGQVSAYDPVAMEHVKRLFPQVRYASTVYEVAEGADALILVTEWNEFRQLDLERLGKSMRARILFDGRRIYSREAAERAGFEYHAVGSASQPRP